MEPGREQQGAEAGERPPFAAGRLEQGLAHAGDLRWAAVDLSAVVETARGRLDLSPVASAALGRALAGASLLLRMALKTPSRLILEIKGDGPLGRVVAEVDDRGNLRGMVDNPRVDVPHKSDGKLAVGAAVGSGVLRVIREEPGRRRYQSEVALLSGEIGEDLAHYLEQSEQTRSAVLVGVLAQPSGVVAAGGMMIEVLPGAPEAALARLEANLAAVSGVSRTLAEGGLEAVVERALAGLAPERSEAATLAYRCRCSRERILAYLVAIARAQSEPLHDEQGKIAVECAFCGEKYEYQAEEAVDLVSGEAGPAGP